MNAFLYIVSQPDKGSLKAGEKVKASKLKSSYFHYIQRFADKKVLHRDS